MIRLTRQAVFMLVALILTTNMAAQTDIPEERQQGYYTLGFNGGVAYQQSDVLTDLSGIGFGLTYGKNLLYKPNGLFSVDARSRFQISRSFGKDIRPSLGIAQNEALNGSKNLDYTAEGASGFVFANHKTNMIEAGLEGVLTLNRLRENTGLGLSVTGGIGLDWYKTSIDQQNANGLYSEQYKNLDQAGARSYTLSQLNDIRDGKYESTADGFNGIGKFGIMPSLGFEVDYDLTSNLSLGLGHRITFSGTDLLDGQRWTDANTLTGNNDILHYTSLGLKYTFDKNKSSKKGRKPYIELIEPYSNDLKTKEANLKIKAKIDNVNNPFDIYLSVNGTEQKFNFNNQTLIGNVRLREGQNKIQISAHNDKGIAEETFLIHFEAPAAIYEEIENYGSPEISFTTPSADGIRLNKSNLYVRAKVRLIQNEKDIELLVNGKKRNFDFDTGIEILDATVQLKEGKNHIEIRAKNRNGQQRLSKTVFYEVPLPYPTVQFIHPAYDNAKVEQNTATIKVALTDIEYASDIDLFVNSNKEPNFYFRKGELKADIRLREGRNNIEIIAKNKRGETREQRVIIYERPYAPVIRAPRVHINAPQYAQSTTQEEMVVIHATLENIFRKSDIRVTNNGLYISNFDFNPQTKILQHNLYLQEGINRLVIEARNEAGSDRATATINFELPLPPPPPTVIAPHIDFIKPRQQAVFEEREILIKAELLGIANKRDIDFRVNREDCLDFRYNPVTGIFRANVRLQSGENIISIKAKNPAGLEKKRLIVYYQKPHAPVITIRQPSATTTETDRITLKAKVAYIQDKRDIRLFLNNQRIRDFQLKGERLEAKLRLAEGNNEIEIIATNQYGEDIKRRTINYYIPQPPSIRVLSVQNNQTVKKDKIILTCNISNLENRKDIRLFVNGRAAGNFDWNGKQMNATLRLKEGRNTVLIKAKTRYGSDEVNLQLNYEHPQLPKIDVLSHSNEAEVQDRKAILKAALENVNHKSDITLLINDKAHSVFTYKSGTLKSPIQLQKGRNKISIKAKTVEGITQKELFIYYKPVVLLPTVKITKPTSIKNTTHQLTAEIEAQVGHIKSKSFLKVFLNETSIDDFSYNAKTNKIKATVVLKIGLNTIKVQAINESGSEEKEIHITRISKRPSISKEGKISKKSVKVKHKNS